MLTTSKEIFATLISQLIGESVRFSMLLNKNSMTRKNRKGKERQRVKKDGGKIRKKDSGRNQLNHSCRVFYDIRIKLNQYHNQLQYYHASIFVSITL